MLKNFNKFFRSDFKISSASMIFYKVSSHRFILISPQEIRNTIRLMRINNTLMNFSQFNKYLKWKNCNEAIKVFLEYSDFFTMKFRVDYLKNANIFEDLKLLLNNLSSDHIQVMAMDYFFDEFTKLLRKLYVNNFKNTDFIDGNIQYCLRSFVFLKTISESEVLVRNNQFMNDFFNILEQSSRIFIHEVYHKNINIFTKNVGLMEEFLSRFLNLCLSKHIIAYNPKFYHFYINNHIEKIISNFENLVLFFILNFKPLIIQEKIKDITILLNNRKLCNSIIIDYINIFMIKNKNILNPFFIIDILNLLSIYRECINFELLNYFYLCIETEINTKNLINFPKTYLINVIKIISKEKIFGGFVLIHKVIQVIIDKYDDLSLEDHLNILMAALKSGYSHTLIVDRFLQSIIINKQLQNLNYNNVKYLKSLIDRFINENYSNVNFFNYLLESISNKLNELNYLKVNYSNDYFINYLKNELIISNSKEEYAAGISSSQDFINYIDLCQIIKFYCLIKLHKNINFTDIINQVEFYDDEGMKINYKFEYNTFY